MPFYFAGILESGNVCEYFKMKQYFNSISITKYDQILYDLGMKEKEHEIYFLEKVKNDKFLPFFEKIFAWGLNLSDLCHSNQQKKLHTTLGSQEL